MAPTKGRVDFEHSGIGRTLANKRLTVPLYQREYAWEEDHVRELLQDLAENQPGGRYFLGNIVLTGSESGQPDISDGQQRLATTTILLAAIRDYLATDPSTDKAALGIEQEFLSVMDRVEMQVVPRLTLNLDDRDYFRKRVIERTGTTARQTAKSTKESHRRIERAADVAAEFVATLVRNLKEDARLRLLNAWVDFIADKTEIVVIIVPDDVDAFNMFETLNDRGLKASQADLVKSYMLKMTPTRRKEAQQCWSQMLGVMESLKKTDLTVDYIRHYTICRNGPTKERELFKRIRAWANSEPRAMDYLGDLSSSAPIYAALFNGDHSLWNEYGTAARGYVRTILDLDVEQIRPLMFSVVRHFTIEEARKALRLFIAWSVRFLIAGGRGGFLDRHYGEKAKEVADKKIITARQLADSMTANVPSDAVFQTAFAEARVSRSNLAKYYLRAMERKVKGEQDPELVPSEEEGINLEHILPVSAGEQWKHIDPEMAEAYYKRLGNMVLLRAKKNVAIGNASYKDKQPVLRESAYILTKEAADSSPWDVQAIAKRQKRLAEVAVQTWPITV